MSGMGKRGVASSTACKSDSAHLEHLVYLIIFHRLIACRPQPLHSTFNVKATSLTKPLTDILVTDFFGDQRRVATRRHRTTPPLPQCTKNSSKISGLDQLRRGADWQTLTLQSDIRAASNRTSHGGGSNQSFNLYTSKSCCITQDLVFSILFLLSAGIMCSLQGRQRVSK